MKENINLSKNKLLHLLRQYNNLLLNMIKTKKRDSTN